jgi:Sec-independent protein translocase protein TatA
MRLFNQDSPGEWEPVLRHIERELGRWARQFKKIQSNRPKEVVNAVDDQNATKKRKAHV